MSADILRTIVTETPIEHEPKHDIESFIYALEYSITRKAVLESQALGEDTRKKLHSFFIPHLGGSSLMTFSTVG